MRAQHRLKSRLKPLAFRDEWVPRTIRTGAGRDIRMRLNRRYDLQREFGLHERELDGAYRLHIDRGSVVYDVGAGDGLTTLIFAKLAGAVVAFEPDVRALGMLRQNLELNPDLAERVIVRESAYRPDGELPEPSFAKVDVDGAELEVLELMPSRPKAVLVETHSAELERGCEAFLGERGYAVRIIRNAWWRRLYPEYRPLELNRWLLATQPR
ncbi:MAG: hypothetical protein ACXVY8_09695 [Gaiellaceae bacterium]